MRTLVLVAALATACSSYRGTAHDTSPAKLAREPGWVLLRDVPYVQQDTEYECGAAAISMVVSYWTGVETRRVVAHFRPVGKNGIAAGKLRDYAREQGLASYVIAGKVEDLARELEAGRPVLVGLTKPVSRGKVLYHYEVVVGLHRDKQRIVTLDPDKGWRENSLEGFASEWKHEGFVTLIVSAKPAAAASAPASAASVPVPAAQGPAASGPAASGPAAAASAASASTASDVRADRD
ncbi:MAG TPA: papain-like cysteine protease family protein [Kofleriaceae bacterium]|nr:papain-like cysteine protease family protein [Kofleriaceae bacterium]